MCYVDNLWHTWAVEAALIGTMRDLGDFIRWMREERGWTQAELAEKVGIVRSALAKRERGDTKKIDGPERRKFAAAFGLSIEDFDAIWRGETSASVPDDHAALERPSGKIPIINSAPAGRTIDYTEFGIDSRDGYEYIDALELGGAGLFAVRVVGDSMMPRLSPGDVVVLRWLDPHAEEHPVLDGRIVFVRFTEEHKNSECTIGRWRSVDAQTVMLHKHSHLRDSVARVCLRRMPGVVEDGIRAAFRESRITADPRTPLHSLRRSRATDLLAEGHDVATVARIQGDSPIIVMRHYHQLTAEAEARITGCCAGVAPGGSSGRAGKARNTRFPVQETHKAGGRI